MTDKLIEFTKENRTLVRAGLKTQTRRSLKLPKWSSQRWEDFELDLDGRPTSVYVETGCMAFIDSPYGWPQETPLVYGMKEPVQIVSLNSGNLLSPLPWVELIYLDDNQDSTVQACEISWGDRKKILSRRNYQKPTTARYMLSSLARTKLAGVRVWVEKLGDISDKDCLAEGIEYYDPGDGRGHWQFRPLDLWGETPQEVYKAIWESINGPGSWNPEQWVWCVEFKLLHTGN